MFLHGIVSHNLQYEVKEKYLKFRNLRVGRETVGRKRNITSSFFFFFFFFLLSDMHLPNKPQDN